MENKTIQSSWTLIRENPVTPVTPTPLWQWADVSTENKGKSETTPAQHDAQQVDAPTSPPPDWTAEEFHQWQEERFAIQWEGRPPEIRPDVDEDQIGQNPWDSETEAAPGEDFVRWEDLDDPVDCPDCGSFDCWWDLRDNRHCMKCHPPNKARLLRSTTATQRRRAERRRQAAQHTEVTP